jgi:hypothetical protein
MQHTNLGGIGATGGACGQALPHDTVSGGGEGPGPGGGGGVGV